MAVFFSVEVSAKAVINIWAIDNDAYAGWASSTKMGRFMDNSSAQYTGFVVDKWVCRFRSFSATKSNSYRALLKKRR